MKTKFHWKSICKHLIPGGAQHCKFRNNPNKEEGWRRQGGLSLHVHLVVFLWDVSVENEISKVKVKWMQRKWTGKLKMDGTKKYKFHVRLKWLENKLTKKGDVNVSYQKIYAIRSCLNKFHPNRFVQKLMWVSNPLEGTNA